MAYNEDSRNTLFDLPNIPVVVWVAGSVEDRGEVTLAALVPAEVGVVLEVALALAKFLAHLNDTYTNLPVSRFTLQ